VRSLGAASTRHVRKKPPGRQGAAVLGWLLRLAVAVCDSSAIGRGGSGI